MKPRNWWRLYVPLAVAAAAVCLLFWSSIGWRHLAVVAVCGIAAPLGLAWLGGWLTHELEVPEARPAESVKTSVLIAFSLFLIACAKYSLLGFFSSQFTPALHDEWSYLFGAQTFALGRLSNATPPHAEFFDAFHILAIPRWVTRYPPGHPAMLSLGVLVGWPPVVVIGLNAATVVWIYLLGKELSGRAAGRLAGILGLLAPGLDFLASGFLSQSTFLFAVTGCTVCTVRGIRRASLGWSVAAGSLAGLAILTRPYSALACGFPLAGWFLFRIVRTDYAVSTAAGGERIPIFSATPQSSDSMPTLNSAAWAVPPLSLVNRLLLLPGAAVPVLASLGFCAMYNLATTGSAGKTAWGEYNRQFEPDNTLGLSTGAAQPIPAELSTRKMLKAQTIAAEKLRFTWQAALQRAVADPRRFSEMVFPAVGFYGLIAFFPTALRRRSGANSGTAELRWLMTLAIVGHYVAYSFFYSTWGVYGHETIPFLIVLVSCGLVDFWRQGRDSDRPGLAAVVPLALLATLAVDGRQIGRFIERRQEDTKVQREFLKKLQGLEKTPAIVFIRFDASRRHEVDLINNSPDLNARVLVVLDLAERNAELLESFPQRHGYLYDEATGSLTEWPPPKGPVPARAPTRPDSAPTAASPRQELAGR